MSRWKGKRVIPGVNKLYNHEEILQRYFSNFATAKGEMETPCEDFKKEIAC